MPGNEIAEEIADKIQSDITQGLVSGGGKEMGSGVANALNPTTTLDLLSESGEMIANPFINNDLEKGLHKGTEDWGKDLYTFENKSDYNNNCGSDMGVEIDGFLFFPEEVNGDNSFSNREYNRTKIMSGGEFVTRGQYQPRSFSFTTFLTLDPNEPYMYDKVFTIMENKPCEIISPYMGENFKAEVQIEKTHPKSSPGVLNLNITINEIVDPKSTLVGDSLIEYPPTTYLSNTAISVKSIKHEPKSDEERELEQITYDWKAKDDSGKVHENRYVQGH